MPSQTELANAIRALAMDAVQAAKAATPVRRWVWRILPRCFGIA